MHFVTIKNDATVAMVTTHFIELRLGTKAILIKKIQYLKMLAKALLLVPIKQ